MWERKNRLICRSECQSMNETEEGGNCRFFTGTNGTHNVNRRHKNRDSDQHFNRSARHAEQPKCRERQRGGVPDREGRHNLQNAQQAALHPSDR
jgi:hypothetical protein